MSHLFLCIYTAATQNLSLHTRKNEKISKANSASVVALKQLENNKAWKMLNFTKKNALQREKKH